jgi:hypothetical protein
LIQLPKGRCADNDFGRNGPAVDIEAIPGRAVDVKVPEFRMDQHALFSCHGVEVAPLTVLGIRTSRDKAGVPRGLTNLRWRLPRKIRGLM